MIPDKCEEFAAILSEIVEISPFLNRFDLFIRRSHKKGLEHIIRNKLAEKQMGLNWDIDYRIVIK